MHNLFEILEKAAKAFNQSDGIKSAYAANASIKGSIHSDINELKKLKERAANKNIPLIEDPFRDQLIPAFASIFQTVKEIAGSEDLLNEDVLVPYNIKVLEALLGDEYQSALTDNNKKEILSKKFSNMSQAISHRQRTDPQLDSDLIKLAILTEINKKLKNPALSDKEAIQASDKLIQRRGIELLKKPAQSKYRLLNWLRNIFPKKSAGQLNFFSVMNKLEKNKSTAMVDLSKGKKTQFKI